MRGSLTKCEDDLNAQKMRAGELEGVLKSKNEELQATFSRLEEANALVRSLEAQVETKRADYEALNQHLGSQTERYEQLLREQFEKVEISRAEVQKLQTEVSDLNGQLGTMKEELAARTREYMFIVDILGRHSLKPENLGEGLEKMFAEVKDYREMVEKLSIDIQRCHDERSNISNVQSTYTNIRNRWSPRKISRSD